MTRSMRIVVIGGGLAGLSAAIEASSALQEDRSEGADAEIVIVEKEERLGGNSMKASSGISALAVDNGDSLEKYVDDTLASGGGDSDNDLVNVLAARSVDALRFLESFGLELPETTQLGGHSVARTFVNASGPNVGAYITKALIAAVQARSGVSIHTGAKVCGISQHGDRVEGVTLCEHGEEREVRADCVIIATGGFGYSSELLQEYAPKAAAYGTTNGPWATGDGMVLGKQAGGLLKHMDKVQVHPTGIVNPQDPAQRNKWLAPERLRGCGGFLVSREGHRFVDELQRRDTVVDALCRQQGETAFLVVSSAAAARYGEGALKFYAMKGMAHCADNLESAAEWIGCSTAALAASVDNYNAAASGARADALGRAHFATGPVDAQAPMYVLQVAPVTHYCMGGLAIDSTAQVVGAGGVPIKGLLAAGEVTGGVHGRNRLAGNSLLDCVVFGRIAGATAARIALSNAQAA